MLKELKENMHMEVKEIQKIMYEQNENINKEKLLKASQVSY